MQSASKEPERDPREWVIAFTRRLRQLTEGRWMIVLTINGKHRDWSIVPLGEIEATTK